MNIEPKYPSLKPGDELTIERLDALREQAYKDGNTDVVRHVGYVLAARSDHEQRLLFSRLLGKYALQFAEHMRSMDYLTEPETMGRKMYFGIIDNFIDAFKGWYVDEPKSDEPSDVERTFSEDGTSMHVRYVHWTASKVGAMLAESLLRPEGDPERVKSLYFNNVTLTMTHVGRKFAVTLQNVTDGKTPAEQLNEARAERDAALASEKQWRGLLDDAQHDVKLLRARVEELEAKLSKRKEPSKKKEDDTLPKCLVCKKGMLRTSGEPYHYRCRPRPAKVKK